MNENAMANKAELLRIGDRDAQDCFASPDKCLDIHNEIIAKLNTFNLPPDSVCFKYHYPVNVHVTTADEHSGYVNGTYFSTGTCKETTKFSCFGNITGECVTTMKKDIDNGRLDIDMHSNTFNYTFWWIVGLVNNTKSSVFNGSQ